MIRKYDNGHHNFSSLLRCLFLPQSSGRGQGSPQAVWLDAQGTYWRPPDSPLSLALSDLIIDLWTWGRVENVTQVCHPVLMPNHMLG